jgi:hypothetical protein
MTVGAALGAGGVYGLLDRLAEAAAAAPARHAVGRVEEQYLFTLPTVTDNGVQVLAPPLHRAVVTANLTQPPTIAAQAQLERVLAGLEQDGLADYTARGGVTVAWGTPYFAQLSPAVVAKYLPLDRIASAKTNEQVPALVDAVRFRSDPEGVVLESNDVAVIVAADKLERVNTMLSRVFGGESGSLFHVTSIRRGFIDSSALGTGKQSLTKQMALEAGLPAAERIPDQAQLFLGFTSTQQSALAPSNVPSFETLPGLTDQWPSGYFAGGTALHLSHLSENLEEWYAKPYAERVSAAFGPNQKLRGDAERLTLATHPATEAQVRAQYARSGHIGHSPSMQPLSRLQMRTRDNYGRMHAAGTALAFRADFNTLDNPFAFSASPSFDGYSSAPAAGLHFLAYTPTSTMFQLLRESMEGWYGKPGLGAGAVHGPFNRVIAATHRQNFLVPPRSRRSFPLAEIAVPASAAAAPVATSAVELYV